MHDTDNHTSTETPASSSPESMFNPEQVRILACLMEKQLTTPNGYPLTLNSVMLACNQKTNRHPVMNLNQGEVGNLVNKLADDEQIRVNVSSRADKYSHALRGNLNLDPKQQAILCVLMLREPLTLKDIEARTARMAEFESTGEIEKILQDFSTRATPLVQRIPAGSGRREDRFSHTFAGEVNPAEIKVSPASVSKEEPHIPTTRMDELEARVVKLEAALEDFLN